MTFLQVSLSCRARKGAYGLEGCCRSVKNAMANLWAATKNLMASRTSGRDNSEMTQPNLSYFVRVSRSLTGLALVMALLGCAQRPAPAGFQDPREAQNREIHEFNKAVDRTLLKPFSGSGNSLPAPLRDGISNAARNLDAPGQVVNNLLQGRPHHAVENSFRFLLNSTIGLAGLFDPATEFGIFGKETDFGETLHVWGAGEGNYVELPLLGPSTERDMVGMAVDAALNPLRFVLPRKELNATTAIGLAGSAMDRGRYSETVDSILYDSADSYAQARLMYLQNRRFKLGQTVGQAADGAFEDPYEDPYGN